MQKFRIDTQDKQVVRNFVDAVSATFGSLCAPFDPVPFLTNYSEENMAMAMSQWAVASVPTEGEIHPQRADVVKGYHDKPAICTPGGVTVEISGGQTFCLCIDFGRDSAEAAGRVIARLGETPINELLGSPQVPADVRMKQMMEKVQQLDALADRLREEGWYVIRQGEHLEVR